MIDVNMERNRWSGGGLGSHLETAESDQEQTDREQQYPGFAGMGGRTAGPGGDVTEQDATEGQEGDDPTTRPHAASCLGWRNWWIEAAFRDLKGQMEDKPVYKLLQENEETVTKAPVYASSGEVRPFEERQPWLEYPYEPPGCSPKGRWACRPRAKASATRGTGNDTKSGCRRPPEPRSG